MKIFYQTKAEAIGGRAGRTQLVDGSLGFDLVPFSEQEKHGTNPEQLFAMGYAACFDSALNHVAPMMNLELKGSKTRVEVGIGQKADGGFALDIDIHCEVIGISEENARQLIARTHQVCPYSAAIQGNIDVRLTIRVVNEFTM